MRILNRIEAAATRIAEDYVPEGFSIGGELSAEDFKELLDELRAITRWEPETYYDEHGSLQTRSRPFPESADSATVYTAAGPITLLRGEKSEIRVETMVVLDNHHRGLYVMRREGV